MNIKFWLILLSEKETLGKHISLCKQFVNSFDLYKFALNFKEDMCKNL